jgi:putative metallohydrolase (TIGR04338 family)
MRFLVNVRYQRCLIRQFEVEAPSAKACRPAVRAYLADEGLTTGRASWRESWLPVGQVKCIPHTYQGSTPLPVRSRRLRDSQRQRVYNADRALFPSWLPNNCAGTFDAQSRFSSLSFVQNFVDDVTTAEGMAPIKVVASRGSTGRARYSNRSIIMPPWTWFAQYTLHEIAHHLAADRLGSDYKNHTVYEVHGPEFVGVLHELIERHMGADAAKAYAAACRRYGVHSTAVTAPLLLPVHDFPLAAGPTEPTKTEQGYIDSYRRFRQGQRSSAPSLRKGMTKQRGAELRAAINNEVL